MAIPSWSSPQLGCGRLCLCVLLAMPLGSNTFTPQGVDPYVVLGLERGGNSLEKASLKKAYRQAALRWHPDKVKTEERADAEKKFIEIAWAYEVLSDPNRRDAYAVPPQPGQSYGDQQGQPGATAGERSYSMEEAAKVFREAFGKTSPEYSDLINHLAASAGTGDKENWAKHAKDIQDAMEKQGGDFSAETVSKDGNERMKTSRSNKNGAQTTVTEHSYTSTSVSGGGEAPAQLTGDAAKQHAEMMKAHNAAHEAAMAQHNAAVKAAQQGNRLGGGGRNEL